MGGFRDSCFNEWIDLRSQAFRQRFRLLHAKPEQGRIVFFGDSDFEFWHTLETAFPRVINCGLGGAMLYDMAAYVPELVEKYKPRAVVLVGGDNDFTQFGLKPLLICESFARILTGLGDLPVAFVSTKPMYASKKHGRKEAMRHLNALIFQLQASRKF